MSPGVVVTTATRSGPSAPLRAPSGQAFFVGITERGATDQAVLVRSMADVNRLLGSRVNYGNVWDQLNTYFNEGGIQAYVARVVGAGATSGTLTLNDRAGVPQPTLQIDAANPGAWSSNLEVEVRDGASPDTVRITLYLNGDVVEDVTNIASPADASSRFSTSPYVRITDLGSASAAPDNLPVLTAPTPLSAGTDDRATVVDQDYIDALDLFSKGYGDGAVAIPGLNTAAIWNGIDAHCKANHRIGLLAAARGETSDTLRSLAATMNSEYVGLFAPWVQVSDGATGIRTISPEGFVAAKRAQAHEAVGPWQVPAGVNGVALSLVGLDQEFTPEEADTLDNSKVSIIRRIAGGYRLYGWRSLSNDPTQYAYLKDRDLLNRLVVEAEKRLENYVFATIDNKGQLLSAVQAELIGMVDPIREAGGLFENYDDDGNIIDPGYLVQTGPDVNTAQSLANNEIHARLLVRVSPVAGLVSLTIVKVGVLAGF